MQLIVETTRATIRESYVDSSFENVCKSQGGSSVLLNLHLIIHTRCELVRFWISVYLCFTCINNFMRLSCLDTSIWLLFVWIKGANTSVVTRVCGSLRSDYILAYDTYVVMNFSSDGTSSSISQCIITVRPRSIALLSHTTTYHVLRC